MHFHGLFKPCRSENLLLPCYYSINDMPRLPIQRNPKFFFLVRSKVSRCYVYTISVKGEHMISDWLSRRLVYALITFVQDSMKPAIMQVFNLQRTCDWLILYFNCTLKKVVVTQSMIPESSEKTKKKRSKKQCNVLAYVLSKCTHGFLFILLAL